MCFFPSSHNPYMLISIRMSDAGDEIKVDAVETVEVAAEAPKGKLSVEDALQVGLQ